ncbi:DUF4936 family protein [Pseudoduganella plicata]|uniref:DUF4936 family protein n=1 Tax=Pseudoduganella plicata TaxID=321984 RepID=A0A4P7BB01_9BURK|nr:DUF4936 family protein [Pseudoduganella plicata]QBQ35203.1 DUF4936 family protein [Pseudoduganella plicata]GGZ05095.1 hypothetical protein GCM10007388_43360 [Pseudoduganella plicata]
MDLYVYYKVRDEDAATLRERIASLQRQLADAHGVAPQLKRRPGAQDGLQTWMEVYPDVGAGFAAALDEACATAGLAALAGPRHTEVFTDLS